MQALLRFLELVRRELSADDVRGEIGGKEPPEGSVWAMTPGGVRVVAMFETPPDDLEDKRARLRALAESFASLGAVIEEPAVAPPRPAGHELDEALDVLAQRARALAAIVVDDRSPVIWGSSLVPHGPEDVDEAVWIAKVAATVRELGEDLAALVGRDTDAIRAALAAAGDPIALARDVERIRELGPRTVDRVHLLAIRAIASVRKTESHRPEGMRESQFPPPMDPELSLLVRPFATIYRLVLVFDGPFSELHAEAALIHGLPAIERLVTSLPPRDPHTGGAKVAVLRRLRRV